MTLYDSLYDLHHNKQTENGICERITTFVHVLFDKAFKYKGLDIKKFV